MTVIQLDTRRVEPCQHSRTVIDAEDGVIASYCCECGECMGWTHIGKLGVKNG